MKKKDFLWLLAYPVYQTIGTFRHEVSHALAAMAEGAEVTQFVFWPNFRDGKVLWGHVAYEGSTTWFTTAAPYFCDLLVFFVALFIILEARPQRRWLWLNILIIGMLSSLVNSAYNYFDGLARSFNDIGELVGILDPVAVRLYFTLTMLFYAWGVYYCHFRKKPRNTSATQAQLT
jgi:Peptidase M50B-like